MNLSIRLDVPRFLFKATPTILFLALNLSTVNAFADKGYGKYGQCKGKTKKEVRCKSNAGKTGYCGKHK